MGPRQGKWWNEAEGKWVLTDLSKVEVPESDADILGGLQDEIDSGKANKDSSFSGEVVDRYYYDVLEVAPDVDASTIKRRYYLLARKYHPDKHPGDAEAAEKFKAVAEAYQVLSDSDLRQKYNREGREGMAQEMADGQPQLDPQVLFAFLFGSDKFTPYTGPLATATSASIGDSPKISVSEARALQKRRVTRLALHLVKKLDPWVANPSNRESLEAEWVAEANDLASASYGYQMLRSIGELYQLTALMYQGSLENGQALPSLSKWAKAKKANMDSKRGKRDNKIETLKAGIDMMKLQTTLEAKMKEAKTDEEKAAIAKEMEDGAAAIMLRALWTTTVVDISATIYETVQMVLFDQSVDKATRAGRASALKKLGDVWLSIHEPVGQGDEAKDAKQLYEEAAFAAMVETIKRKDEAMN